ncbi:MAG: M43 family zinc metalloprotease [Bacteroidota bacterium]
MLIPVGALTGWAQGFCNAPGSNLSQVCDVQGESLTVPSSLLTSSFDALEIPVVFHIITDESGVGEVPMSVISEQMRILNDGPFDHPSVSFSFKLIGVTETAKSSWFNVCVAGTIEGQMKTKLAIDPARVLNVYVSDATETQGWAFLPGVHDEDSIQNWVFVDTYTLPDIPGQLQYRSQGETTVHEIGHYLGLRHTYFGGCASPGDSVDDTPYQAVSNKPDDTLTDAQNCDLSKDTCPLPGTDPITNYMDLSADFCRSTFTTGQFARMEHEVDLHRPTLLNNYSNFLNTGEWVIYLDEDLVIDDNQTYSFFDVEIRSDPGVRIVVDGTLNADNTAAPGSMTFTAADQAQGWGGIRFEPGSGGVLKNGIVDRVLGYGGAAITINDASPTLRNMLIQNDLGVGLDGIYIWGSQSDPLIAESEIRAMAGDGIVVSANAEATLDRNLISNSGSNGVLLGFGANVLLTENTIIGSGQSLGSGDGIDAVAGAIGTLAPYYYLGDGYNTIDGSAGRGLYARSNGRIYAGNSAWGRFNTISDDVVRASGGGSIVQASADYWDRNGDGNGGDLPWTIQKSGGVVTADSYCLDEPVVGSGCTLNSQSSRTSLPSPARLAYDNATLEAAQGDFNAAVRNLAETIRLEPGTPLAAAAFGEVVRLVATLPDEERGGMVAEVLPVLRREATHPSHRRWAGHALARVLLMEGYTTEAVAVAKRVRETSVGAAGAGARLSEADEARLADDALLFHALLEAEAYEEAETVLAAMRSYAEGELETDLAAQDLAATIDGPTLGEGNRANAQAKSGVAETTPVTSIYPNPFSEGASVPVRLAEEVHLRVAVYDVLGRQIALVHDGVLAAGDHLLALDGARLASGVYVVRARVGGGATIHTQRVTVLR